MILAGAGSGKTRVLTHRVAHLISEGVEPRNILAVTFTNKAAGEMKQRIKTLLQGKVNFHPFRPQFEVEPFVGTFHSFAVQILRREIGKMGFKEDFVIFDAQDQLSAVKQAMKKLHIPFDDVNPRAVRAAISRAKCDLIKPAGFLNYSEKGFFTELAAKVYQQYQKDLKQMAGLDFDDLIMHLVDLFEANPDILEKYQDRFQYILVDEYQDTNKAQYVLIKQLASKNRNLCVVGDDWQSIYSFRGANIQNILNFEKDYPEAKTVYLEQNYRSTGHILDSAHAVMEQSEERKEKKLWTDNGSGEKVKSHTATNAYREAGFVIDTIMEHSDAQTGQLPEAAILYRTNAQSRALEEVLMERGVPYQIVGGVKFYERKEIKDMLAYLRLVLNSDDNISFERVVNMPARRVGKRTITVLTDASNRLGISLFDYLDNDDRLAEVKGVARKGLGEFRSLINIFRKQALELTLPELIDFALRKSGLEDFLRDGSEEGESRFENVLELKTVARRFVTSKEDETGSRKGALDDLRGFLEEVSLVSDHDEGDEKSSHYREQKNDQTIQVQESSRKVILMTVHSAKGLEFDHVFLVGMEESIFPHSRSLFDPSEMEEERRLCYVGMTRAKKYLYLLRAEERHLFGSVKQNMASRFIEEIPESLIEEVSLFSKFNDSSSFPTNSNSKEELGEVQYIDFDI